MRYIAAVAAAALAVVLHLPIAASDASMGGVWTKTTHPDPKNIAVFYVDDHTLKATGYGMISDRPAIWYAEGNLLNRHAKLTYRYSKDNTPNGWEPEGVMQLRLSEDGSTMTGRATSRSGAWSDLIEFKRVSRNSN